MLFDNLHIILSSLLLLLIIASVVLYVKYGRRSKFANRRIKKIEEKFGKDKLYFEKEIKRLSYILEDYKQKNGKKSLVSSQAENVALVNDSVSANSGQTSSSLITDRQTPEDFNFKEKNKKLWELSVAVHKEKERINGLKKEIEHRHNEVTKSITYAQRIQKALLPTSKILGIRFTDYYILWKPRDIVSGDFYWFKRLEDKVVIVVADCTGHGVPGAFMSLLGISFLNDILTKDENLASYQILDRLREMIKLALQQQAGKRRTSSDGMDIGLCIINHKTLEMDFAGANNPMYLIRNGEIMIFKENRNPVGVHPFEKPFSNHHFQLQKDDRLYMFSDGFIDQFGGNSGRKFLKKNFQRLLLQLASQNLPMQVEKELMDETFTLWRGEKHPQVDDVLILGLKV